MESEKLKMVVKEDGNGMLNEMECKSVRICSWWTLRAAMVARKVVNRRYCIDTVRRATATRIQ